MNQPQLHTDDTHLSPDELAGSLAMVQAVFRRFRPVVLARAGKSAYTSKQDGSPVTATDVEIEQALKAELAQHYPALRVYGEEGGYDDHMQGAFWLVDPIDGTESFIKNIPAFTSMAVLIQGGEAVAAVIYNLSTSDMYIAQKGAGAFKNGQRLDVAALPLPGLASCKEEFVAPLNALLQSAGVACEQGPKGAGYGFSQVADGQAAARFSMHSLGYIHDYAPGALLVREAGGVLLPILDDTYTYTTRSFVACHPALAPLLRAHIAQLRALDTPAVAGSPAILPKPEAGK